MNHSQLKIYGIFVQILIFYNDFSKKIYRIQVLSKNLIKNVIKNLSTYFWEKKIIIPTTFEYTIRNTSQDSNIVQIILSVCKALQFIFV